MVRKFGFGPKVFAFRERRVTGYTISELKIWMAVLDSNQNSEGQSLLSYRVKRTAIRKLVPRIRFELMLLALQARVLPLHHQGIGGGPGNRTPSPLSRRLCFRDSGRPFSAVLHKNLEESKGLEPLQPIKADFTTNEA